MTQLQERAENISRVFSPDHHQVAQKILALLPEQGWRLASEPPDSGRPVLISDGFSCYAAAWDGHNQQWLFQGTGDPACHITHWRELPPPPQPATAETNGEKAEEWVRCPAGCSTAGYDMAPGFPGGHRCPTCNNQRPGDRPGYVRAKLPEGISIIPKCDGWGVETVNHSHFLLDGVNGLVWHRYNGNHSASSSGAVFPTDADAIAAALKAPPIETKAGEGFKADDMQPMSLANSYMKGRADAVNDMLEMEQAIQAKDAEIARLAGEAERYKQEAVAVQALEHLKEFACVNLARMEYTISMLSVERCGNPRVRDMIKHLFKDQPTPPATGEKQDPRLIAPNGRGMVRYVNWPTPDGRPWGQDDGGAWWFWPGCGEWQASRSDVRERIACGELKPCTFDGQPLPQGQDRNVTVADMLRLAEAYRAKGVYAQANCIDEVFKGVS